MPPSNSGPIRCDLCEETFSRHFELDYHKEIVHPGRLETVPRVTNIDYGSLGIGFSRLALSNSQDPTHQAPIERGTQDWRNLSPLAMDIPSARQRLSKRSVPRSSFETILSEHHGPVLGDATPLSEIDVDADPTPWRTAQAHNEASSKSQDNSAPIPKTFSELTWRVEQYDAIETRQRPNSVYSDYGSMDEGSTDNYSVETNSEAPSAISSNTTTPSINTSPMLRYGKEPSVVWRRPWARRETVIPGTWLCPHCERGLNVQEDKQTKGMKNEYRRLKIWPPFERLAGWEISQRKCVFCCNHAFCKLFKHTRKQEPTGVPVRD